MRQPELPTPGPNTPCCATSVTLSPTAKVDDLPSAMTRKIVPPHTLLGEIEPELQAAPPRATQVATIAYQMRPRMRSSPGIRSVLHDTSILVCYDVCLAGKSSTLTGLGVGRPHSLRIA